MIEKDYFKKENFSNYLCFEHFYYNLRFTLERIVRDRKFLISIHHT